MHRLHFVYFGNSSGWFYCRICPSDSTYINRKLLNFTFFQTTNIDWLDPFVFFSLPFFSFNRIFLHRKIACAHVSVWFVKMSNWLSDPKESSIVYRDVIFISTKQKVSIVCEMIRPINVCVKRKAVVIRKLIHRWYQSYENTLPNTIRNSTNWLARIWDGQRNKKKGK